MVGMMTKLIAYWKAPRATFTLLHPVRAAKLGALVLVGTALFGGSTAR